MSAYSLFPTSTETILSVTCWEPENLINRTFMTSFLLRTVGKLSYFKWSPTLWSFDMQTKFQSVKTKGDRLFWGRFSFLELKSNRILYGSLSLRPADWDHPFYLFHVRVVLSGRWVLLWEPAGLLDDILSLPEPSVPLEERSFFSRIGHYICL